MLDPWIMLMPPPELVDATVGAVVDDSTVTAVRDVIPLKAFSFISSFLSQAAEHQHNLKGLGLIISPETVTNPTMDDFTPKTLSKDSSPQKSSLSSSGCFDCNICLDFAVDPVVTLCGHLYCWPCIYKWLQMEDRRITPQSCPVCKAALSEHSLVPLYGRGMPTKRHHHQAIAIPRRPSVRHHHLLHDHSHEGELLSSSSLPSMMSSAAVGLLGEMAVAVLPWAVRNHQAEATMAGGLFHTSPYQRAGGGSTRLRRQELQVERWLNQMWVFLFCCAILCLLWF